MPSSPLDGIENAAVKFTIKINGAAIKDEYAVQSIKVDHAINRISYAEIVLVGELNFLDGSMPITDGNDLDPGNRISIEAGYADAKALPIFSGLIIDHELIINSGAMPTFRMSCKHDAISMTFNETEAQFNKMTASDIIKSITGKYGLNVSVDACANTRELSIQYNATDWDYIMNTCHDNGFIICMDGESMRIGKPVIDLSPVLKITMGESLISFEGKLSAADQPLSVRTSAWDPASQSMLSAVSIEPDLNKQGNISAKSLSARLGQTELDLVTTSLISQEELKTLANAELLWKRLRAVQGKVSFIGNATLKTGDLVELDGVGKKFNGQAFVSSIEHTISDGTWLTSIQFGLDQKDLLAIKANTGLTTAQQVPGMYGLQVGIVTKVGSDPMGEYRVQVNIASNNSSEPGIWARMSSFYASSSVGAFFYPEIGDEVILGFPDNDPRFPVILGSLYSSVHQAPEMPTDENFIKSLTTRSKMRLSFDDENKVISLDTPAGNTIRISEENKEILIADENGNRLLLSNDGIELNSVKDISLKAAGKISLSANGDVNISGTNINNQASIGFSGKGIATAEISAAGQTTVKGAMVMIN